jgi:nitroreductase
MVNGMDARPFSEEEKRGVYRAIHERRDVRGQFLPGPIPAEVLGRILNAAHHAPSVGFMQPWDFIVIEDASVRRSVYENFERANRCAAALYASDERDAYRRMKLAGSAAEYLYYLRSRARVGPRTGTADRSRHRLVLDGVRGAESLAGGARRRAGRGVGEHSRF